VTPRPRPRVLLVDDDASIVEITTLILQFSGYEVVAAEDGAQAWCAYLEHGCDLLLTDQDMPHLSGLELIALIRSHGDPVPVILTSGRVACDELPPATRSQIDAVLPKPFASDLLLETIRTCLRQQAS
jgi:DNA-binding response OmpR family regulator